MRRTLLICCSFVLLALGMLSATGAYAEELVSALATDHPSIIFPKAGLEADELGVIVNDADPQSVAVAEYYRVKRKIPDANMIHVTFPAGKTDMSVAEFEKIKALVDAKTPANVQAFALTWTTPFRVGCMSVTTAFAAGFDKAFCSQQCAETRPSPYFNTSSTQPFTDFGWRPTMSLAGTSVAEVKRLIDRGVASDSTQPTGTGYLVDTSNKTRNVRAVFYDEVMQRLGTEIKLEHVHADYIESKKDVLFYFTGLGKIANVDSNTFVPGAMADHLTSSGGILVGQDKQMSSLRWLEAGATGSYGAVVEPCNFLSKFPHPGIAISHYIKGETLIEAYWKSVAMPGQGIFIGEPLAKPFGGYSVSYGREELTLRTRTLPPGRYMLLAADSAVGPYRIVATGLPVGRGLQQIHITHATKRYYRLVQDTGEMPRL